STKDTPMNTTLPSPKKRPRSSKKAKVEGGGAIAQGKRAKTAGEHAVIVERDNIGGAISTGAGDIYQTFIQQAARPVATPAQLCKGYLAWLSMRANELPLFASDSGQPLQLSSVYTVLLTEARGVGEAQLRASGRAERAMASRDASRQSALEALDQEQYLVLMGGPGS